MRIFKLPHLGAHIDLDSVQIIPPLMLGYPDGSGSFDTDRAFLLSVHLALRDGPVVFEYVFEDDYVRMTADARGAAKADARRKAEADRDALLEAWGKDSPVVA